MHLLFDLAILLAELGTAYVQVQAHMYVERFDVLLYMGKETLGGNAKAVSEWFRKKPTPFM